MLYVYLEVPKVHFAAKTSSLFSSKIPKNLGKDPPKPRYIHPIQSSPHKKCPHLPKPNSFGPKTSAAPQLFRCFRGCPDMLIWALEQVMVATRLGQPHVLTLTSESGGILMVMEKFHIMHQKDMMNRKHRWIEKETLHFYVAHEFHTKPNCLTSKGAVTFLLSAWTICFLQVSWTPPHEHLHTFL